VEHRKKPGIERLQKEEEEEEDKGTVSECDTLAS
jgi:hypothetical protein